MIKHIMFAFISIFVLFFSGCAKDEKTTQKLVLIGPGFLNMPIIEGSSIPDDCMYENFGDIGELPHLACIIYPLASEGINGKDWDSEYAASLAKLGWNIAGGEANVYFLEKPIEHTDCSESLALIGGVHSTSGEVSSVMKSGEHGKVENGLFIFAKLDEAVCDEERRIK